VFSNILVAVDGSDSAKKAFEKSVFLAQKCNSKIDLVHVIACELGGDSATTLEQLDDIKSKAMQMLVEYKVAAEKNKVPIEITVNQGDPARIIIELARTRSYDLIIMGTRGIGTFRELLLGSVSQKVMHHANCPVMVVR
jgi:nucleotide-binding universal stress UspA family protein